MVEIPHTHTQLESFRHNRVVEALFCGTELAVDVDFAMRCLHRYWCGIYNVGDRPSLQASREAWKGQVVVAERGAAPVRHLSQSLVYNEQSTPPGSVALFRIADFMMAEDSGGSAPIRGMRGVSDDLFAAYENRNISAIIIEFNSGGGELMAMEVLGAAMKERNKPIVAHVIYAASAAYGAAAHADEVIALSTASKVGSIGAVITVNKLELDVYNQIWLDLYGAAAPNKNEEFRAALSGDFSKLQKAVDDATERFHRKIKSLRDLKGDDDIIAETISGRMFGAELAKRRGLIDAVGGFEFAMKRAKALSNIFN